MSHLINPRVDTVYTPNNEIFRSTWHRLETVADGDKIALDGSNCPDVFCPVIECGIRPDFNGDINVSDSEEIAEQLKNWKLIGADCRGGKAGSFVPLHVPKKGYRIHQNRDLFNCMIESAQSVLGSNGFQIATVGTLGSYSQFFLSLAIKGHDTFEVGSSDIWKQFFNLNTSHDGLISSNRMLSAVRMVCMNTVQFAINDATELGTISAIRHTQNSGNFITVENFANDLKIWLENAKAFQIRLAALKGQSMDLQGFVSFAAGIFTNEGSDELSTNSFNRIADLKTLFSRGRGNIGETRYDAINAFTEFFTSGAGVGSKDVSFSKRVASANFGRGNDWKIEAIRVATNATEFATATKRGEILYADKLVETSGKN